MLLLIDAFVSLYFKSAGGMFTPLNLLTPFSLPTIFFLWQRKNLLNCYSELIVSRAH